MRLLYLLCPCAQRMDKDVQGTCSSTATACSCCSTTAGLGWRDAAGVQRRHDHLAWNAEIGTREAAGSTIAGVQRHCGHVVQRRKVQSGEVNAVSKLQDLKLG